MLAEWSECKLCKWLGTTKIFFEIKALRGKKKKSRYSCGSDDVLFGTPKLKFNSNAAHKIKAGIPHSISLCLERGAKKFVRLR
jgi:hypothetical protein